MIRPRWQGLPPPKNQSFWNRWNQLVAVIATGNLIWVIFDITYLPLRNNFLQSKVYPLPTLSRVLPWQWLPDITKFYDPIKGIIPNNQTTAYLKNFELLDRNALRKGLSNPSTRQLIIKQASITDKLLNNYSFLDSSQIERQEKLKATLRQRTDSQSHIEASQILLNSKYLQSVGWEKERIFWIRDVNPIIASSYSRVLDKNGNNKDITWKIDTPFIILFLLDIIIRSIRLKKRFPRITWSDVLLRRWVDIPLLLPFWRPLRIFPVTARLSRAKLIQMEPLRAVISRGVVALLALEIFEVITLRIVDAVQNLIRSPQLPDQIRSLRSHQSVEQDKGSEIAELIRLWIPLILTQIGPGMRPQLIALLEHAFQKSIENTIKPSPFKDFIVIEQAESALSKQLATGMIDAIIELSKSTGQNIGRKDMKLERLGINTIDRFWEELAKAIETEPVMERSQILLITFLEDIKRSSFKQLKDQGGVDELITELDGLNFSATTSQPKHQD